MPLFVPILRMFMLFLNVWDTFKTIKPPPSRIRNGKAEPPSVRSVTQRKRDLKGCLAVWIVWCCFSMYERHFELVISLFVPFYDEFKALAILFLIFTRARGAEPIFLHLLRPMLRPYTKTIDSSLELFRLLGDLLFAVISFPLRPLGALMPSLFRPIREENDAPPPYSEAPDRRTPSPFNGPHSNGHASTFHPGDPAADMEWRRYPSLPSAYPPTPLVNSSHLPNSRSAPGHVGYDPTTAAEPYAIWVPPVPEEDEEEDSSSGNRQDFHRSLLPPRAPLHPGLGNHDGLSDESDRGAENQIKILTDTRKDDDFSDRSSSAAEGDDMEIDLEDEEENREYNSEDESDEDSFNVTLQTPRVPLSLRPSSTTASRSTIRMRASARSVFADLERETEAGKRLSGSTLLPPLDTTSNSGNSQGSSPSSIDSESLSVSSGDEGASMSLSNPNIGAGTAIVLAGPSLIPLPGDDVTSDSSLGSAPGAEALPLSPSNSASGQGRKRSHSSSFPLQRTSPRQKEKENSTNTLNTIIQRLSSDESASSSRSASDAEHVADPTLQTNVVKRTRALRSAGRVMARQLSEVDSNHTGEEGEIRAEEVLASETRKRRKVISSSASGQGGPSATSESEPVAMGSRMSSRRKPSTADKGKAPIAPDRTRATTRIRRQLSGALPSTLDIQDDSRSSRAKQSKDKVPATDSVRASSSSVPTRRRFEVTHKHTNPSSAKTSTSTLRSTRSTARLAPTSKPLAELSDDVLSDAIGSGLEANDYPLHVARERVRKKQL